MNQNGNTFREGQEEQNRNLDSPHVAFAARSPSIIPTPIYDNTSSTNSTPIISTATSTPSIIPPSPSPLGQEKTSPRKTAFGSKVEIDNSTYGPTYREEYQTEAPTSSSFHRDDFVPLNDDQEEIQLYENTSKRVYQQAPLPEQSRVDIFMSKLKGYQKPSDSSLALEESNNNRNLRRHADQDDGLVRHATKPRGLLYRQLFGSAKYPLFTYVSGIIMVGVFVYELIRNKQLSGSVIQTNPFNPMIGPNYMALVNMGSKFVPCMRETAQYPPTTVFSNCYQSTESSCTAEQLCGFGGFNGQAPNQTFRFFTSIWLHAGVIHILLNLLTHFQFGSEIERRLGLIRFVILYFVTGFWGFILSGVLSGLTTSSMGCSGSLFGLVGFAVTNILIRWKEIRRPGRELALLLITALVSVVLGLFPGIDNFSHIGGFIMGLLFGVILTSLPALASKRSIIFTWIARVIALAIAIVLYIVFLHIFYTSIDLSTVCPSCRYLSCLPVFSACNVQ